MTGWRLGWMVHPARMARHLGILSGCFNTGATVSTQFAGIAALDEGRVFHQPANWRPAFRRLATRDNPPPGAAR